jgi:hypothetical protein
MRCAALLLLAASAAAQQAPGVTLDAALHHLGDTRTSEWKEASAEPEGVKLELRFTGHDTGHEQVLVLKHAHVDERWTLLVNRQPLGELLRGDALRETLLPVPAGVIHDGENELALVPEAPSDDILVGDIRLHEVPLRELLHLLPACITVSDPDGRPLPARITITDEAGARVPVWYAARELTAVRDGLVYSADGRVDVELPEYASYRVHATRGPEWGLAKAQLRLDMTEAPPVVALTLRREVDTIGWIAADTHLHTFTFSGHGDATLTERVVTLAGEGVELAVATDHNHATDYRPEQARLQLSGWYTPVTGDEVTTDSGHFNAFPLDPAGAVPDWRSSDWVQLVDGMRAAGARVVVLNHPRWPDRDRGPFGTFGLDHFTGARHGDVPLHFDAMEIMNATNEHEDAELLLADWFALLNRGEHIVGAGSSDSHTVGDPVGQGRTYARSASDDPAHLDVPALCEALRTGHSTVSLGIFAEARVAGRYGSGDVAPQPGASVPLELRVAAPSWIHPREARVFVDGVVAAQVPVPDGEGRPVNVRLPLEVPLTARDDAWLVCVVLGDAVEGAWWPTLNPYTFAATNPVWLDVDGDGRYTAPRDTAATRLAELRQAGPAAARPADAAVLVHLLDLLGPDARGPLGQALLAAAPPEARERGEAFLDSRR